MHLLAPICVQSANLQPDHDCLPVLLLLSLAETQANRGALPNRAPQMGAISTLNYSKMPILLQPQYLSQPFSASRKVRPTHRSIASAGRPKIRNSIPSCFCLLLIHFSNTSKKLQRICNPPPASNTIRSERILETPDRPQVVNIPADRSAMCNRHKFMSLCMPRNHVFQQRQNGARFIAAVGMGLLGIRLDVHFNAFPFADVEYQGPVVRLSVS